jgi:hypothetical protein
MLNAEAFGRSSLQLAGSGVKKARSGEQVTQVKSSPVRYGFSPGTAGCLRSCGLGSAALSILSRSAASWLAVASPDGPACLGMRPLDDALPCVACSVSGPGSLSCSQVLGGGGQRLSVASLLLMPLGPARRFGGLGVGGFWFFCFGMAPCVVFGMPLG